MQAPPPMMPQYVPKESPVNMLLALGFVAGLGLLAGAGMLVSSAGLTGVTADDAQNRIAYANILWNAGFFCLLAAVFGTAVLRKDVDPLGRLLLWLVAFVLVLLLFVAPWTFFSAPPTFP